jgi:hypothetical protein
MSITPATLVQSEYGVSSTIGKAFREHLVRRSPQREVSETLPHAAMQLRGASPPSRHKPRSEHDIDDDSQTGRRQLHRHKLRDARAPL